MRSDFHKHGPREKGSKRDVVRIALTGGPCAGKSSSMKSLTEALHKLGYDVFFVPEAPTLLMNGGCRYPGLEGGSQLMDFEVALMSLQLQLERSFALVAASTDRPSVLIMDRGLMDIKAYVPEATWRELLQRMGLTEELLLARYDAVLHLVTAADGAERFYTLEMAEGTSARSETPAQARELDARVRTCWSGHPKHFAVDNSTSFQNKLQRATDYVVSVAQSIAASADPA